MLARGGERRASSALVSLGRQLTAFVAIGLVGTLLYFGLYNVVRLGLSPFEANGMAVLVSMAFSFGANRRWTFDRRGHENWMRQAVEFAMVFGTTLLLSSAGLALLFAWRPMPDQLEENMALAAATGATFLLRFWLLRVWVFHPGR